MYFIFISAFPLSSLNYLFHNVFTAGYLTTMPSLGPGLTFYWDFGYGLMALMRRDSDTKRDLILIGQNDFIADYGFAVWVHYVITYG